MTNMYEHETIFLRITNERAATVRGKLNPCEICRENNLLNIVENRSFLFARHSFIITIALPMKKMATLKGAQCTMAAINGS